MTKKRNAAPEDPGIAWTPLLTRVFIGSLFIVSGFSKAAYPPEAFAAALEGYQLFPDSLLMPIALVVPWVELFTGAFLLCGYFTRTSLKMVAALVAVFLVSLGSVIVRRIDLESCGCYGAYGPHLTPGQAFIFDIFLITMVVVLLVRREYPLSLDRWIEKEP
jgi:uncharacterized membrane protein YphA (DoxX/SURF4 family)